MILKSDKAGWQLAETSHGVLAPLVGEAGADIDDEYISRTAQHQPPPASQLYNSHAKEEGETVEGYNQRRSQHQQ